MKKTQEIVKTVESTICDFCGAEYKNSIMHICQGCRRDICGHCEIVINYDPIQDYSYGDNCPRLCKTCFEIMEEVGEEARVIHNDYEVKLDILQDKFRRKCLIEKEN